MFLKSKLEKSNFHRRLCVSSYSNLLILSDTKMQAAHEEYLAMLLAKEWGTTIAEVLKVGHRDHDPEQLGLVYPATPPTGHIYATGRLRWWLGAEVCSRKGLEMWLLRKHRASGTQPLPKVQVGTNLSTRQSVLNSSLSQVPARQSAEEVVMRRLEQRRKALHSHKLPLPKGMEQVKFYNLTVQQSYPCIRCHEGHGFGGEEALF